MRDGVWTNGKRRLTGRWEYNRASDTFIILLNGRDRITGEHRRLTLRGEETPEWGNWKLERRHG